MKEQGPNGTRQHRGGVNVREMGHENVGSL
jgi:hypothetical protein